MNVTAQNILRLAIPNIISNITVPLLGMIDMAVVGHLDSPNYIGAITIGTTMFNFIYWNFSFLRMGTSGFTAHAYGQGNTTEQANSFLRSIFIAVLSGLIIIALQELILKAGFHFFDADPKVKMYAAQYFHVYVNAAPAVLGMYTFNGWFIGMQDAKTPMFITIIINVVNIVLCLIFVYVMNLEIQGVALASCYAQYVGLTASAIVWFTKYSRIRKCIKFRILKDIPALKIFFKVNVDIFVRTLALIAVTTFFISVSTKEGSEILAVNALLMQLFTLFSYFMDGFAYAAEALTGRYIGARQNDKLKSLVKNLFKCGLVICAIFTLIYTFGFTAILNILTDKHEIIVLAQKFHIWVSLIPICGFSAFLWDGIFVGATASRQMRNSMLIAVATYFVLYIFSYFAGFFTNNILWLMFIVYLTIRGLVQAFMASPILNWSK